jgi:hypothetical protein
MGILTCKGTRKGFYEPHKRYCPLLPIQKTVGRNPRKHRRDARGSSFWGTGHPVDVEGKVKIVKVLFEIIDSDIQNFTS